MYRTEAEILMPCKQFHLSAEDCPSVGADAFLIYGAAVSMVLTAVTSTELSQMTTVEGLTLGGGTETKRNLCNTRINHEKPILSHQS